MTRSEWVAETIEWAVGFVAASIIWGSIWHFMILPVLKWWS